MWSEFLNSLFRYGMFVGGAWCTCWTYTASQNLITRFIKNKQYSDIESSIIDKMVLDVESKIIDKMVLDPVEKKMCEDLYNEGKPMNDRDFLIFKYRTMMLENQLRKSIMDAETTKSMLALSDVNQNVKQKDE